MFSNQTSYKDNSDSTDSDPFQYIIRSDSMIAYLAVLMAAFGFEEHSYGKRSGVPDTILTSFQLNSWHIMILLAPKKQNILHNIMKLTTQVVLI